MSELVERFGTRYDAPRRVFANAGSDVAPVYSASYDDLGRLVLEPVGEKNTFEEIQSHRDECDIQRILQRYRNGETDVLNRVQGFFGDVTDMPTTYPEFFNLMKRGREFFDSLPGEVKRNFGDSFEVFLSASQKPDFLSRINPQPVQKEGVKSEPEHAE